MSNPAETSDTDNAIRDAVVAIHDTLNLADDAEARTQVVVELNEELADEGVLVVDIAPYKEAGDERRGPKTGLTREQLLDAIDMERHMRSTRAYRRLGRIPI